MTRLSLRNPIAILMLCVGLVVFSVVTTPRMAVDTFPDLTPPVLVIGTVAPGLGPKDVEKTLTWNIEKYVSATPGVEHVQSISRNNLSIIFVWLNWGVDLNAAQVLVQQQVAFAMSTLPKTLGVLPPFVLQYDPSNQPVVQVAVSGGGLTGPQLYDYALNEIEPVLEGIPGVASAAPNGGRVRQINVVVDPSRAQARGLTANDVARAVADANALLPSGSFASQHFDANVYTNAVAERIQRIADGLVKLKDGRPVHIGDVARVEDSASPQTQAVSIDGKDAVYLGVMRVPGGNTLQIVDAVKQKVSELRNLPPGLVVKPIFDQSTYVRTTFAGLKREILQALVLIALVILLFLQEPRAVLVVLIAIPISFAIILLVLYATGQTLNAFTLGGLTLAMGPLVDISVVVLESIHRNRHTHHHGLATAARKGTEEVAVPALAATLTTVAVLVPVLLLYGLAKRLFSPLALTVAVAMFAGYLVSMMVTPVAARALLGHGRRGKLANAVRGRIDAVADGYARVLRAVLAYRWWIVGAAAALIVGAGLAARYLPSTFFPEIDESMETVYVQVAPGTSLEDANRQMKEMAQTVVRDLPPGTVEMYLANVGYPKSPRSAMGNPNNGPHQGFLQFELSDPEKRSMNQRAVANAIRAILARHYPGVDFLQAPGGLVANVFSNGYVAPIAVEIRGSDLEELNKQEQAIAQVARSIPGVRDVTTSLETDYPEVRVNLDREKAGLVGVSARGAAQATLESTYGNIDSPGTWVDPANGMAYYLVTSYDPLQVVDPAALSRIPLRVGPGGAAVTLGTYGRIHRSLGPVAIERSSLQRVAHVYTQTEGRDVGSAASELEQRLQSDPRTSAIPFRFVGQVQLMRDTFGGLGIAIGLAIMVVFMIMASQFKSLRLPLVMLFTIPATLIGIVTALMAAGQGFSVTALMGVLMVVGIAVSNGILLVDHANRRFAEGLSKLDAVVDAGRTRFVPIMMTSLATIIGLLPTALGLEHGAEANRPLALAVVGGLASSTVLSLFLVPAMFTFLAKRSESVVEVEAEAAEAAKLVG